MPVVRYAWVNVEKKTFKTPHYDWLSLACKDINSKIYDNDKKSDTLQETYTKIHTQNDKEGKFVSTHLEAAECTPTQPRAKCRVPWESQEVMKKRDEFLKCILTQ